MYKCDCCGKNSEPKEKCNIVPVRTRVKHYKRTDKHPEGTTGYETVKEIKVCDTCKENNLEKINVQHSQRSTEITTTKTR